MLDDQTAEALAALVGAVGEAGFDARFLDVLRKTAGTDFCSAFQVNTDGSLRYLFAQGYHAMIPSFAEEASIDYARRYWRRDRMTRQMLASRGQTGPVQVVRQAWNGISDPEYRRACYERAHVLERLTFYQVGEPRIFASAYRKRESGRFESDDIRRLEGIAPIVVSALNKHVAVSQGQAATLRPPYETVAARLLEAGFTLSRREAEVAASLLVGHTQQQISDRAGIALTSIVTYRQRAYRKLGVGSKRELEAFYDRLPFIN